MYVSTTRDRELRELRKFLVAAVRIDSDARPIFAIDDDAEELLTNQRRHRGLKFVNCLVGLFWNRA